MSFLQDYKIFAENTEAPDLYHVWAALAVISSIVGRKVWIDFGHFKIFCNVYIVLVGPPGMRKSTVMGTAKALMRHVKDVPFSADSLSREKLIQDMEGNKKIFYPPDGSEPIIYCPITACITEMHELLTVSKEHMINFLTTIWTGDHFKYSIKGRGGTGESNELLFPYLTILGCTTPEWVTSQLRLDVISGGFSRRALFVNESQRARRITKPSISQEGKEAWLRLIAYGQELKDVWGEFKFAEDAWIIYDQWYQTYDMPSDHKLVGYYETKHEWVLKTSMLISLSESKQLVIEQEHLQMAFALLEQTEKNLGKVFSGMGRNELAQVAEKMVSYLEDMNHPVSMKIILREFFNEVPPANPRQSLLQIIQHLRDSDRIAVYKEKDSSTGEIMRELVATKAVALRDLARQQQAVRKQDVLGETVASDPPPSEPPQL